MFKIIFLYPRLPGLVMADVFIQIMVSKNNTILTK